MKSGFELIADAERLSAIAHAVLLEELHRSLVNFLVVTCTTESEAIKLAEVASTDRLREHWRGRAEAAYSIRRHADDAEKALQKIWKLLPARTPLERSSRVEVRRVLQRVKRAREAFRKREVARRAQDDARLLTPGGARGSNTEG